MAAAAVEVAAIEPVFGCHYYVAPVYPQLLNTVFEPPKNTLRTDDSTPEESRACGFARVNCGGS
jgi:hypothetical protein